MALTEDEITAIVAQLSKHASPGPPGPTGAAGVASVSLKLPTFWTADPEVWFAQVEAQFASRAPAIIVDLTKYNYVVSVLNNTTASEVRALVLNPPIAGRYNAIKAALIAAFGKTQAAKDKELLNLHGLGDRLPSALLRQMRGLNADTDTLFKALFLSQLRADVRRVLAGSATVSLDALALEADRITQAGESTPGVVSGVAGQQKQPSIDLCYFHSRFGKEARNCNGRPCSMAHLVKASTTASGNDQAGC
jgi:hypothetical protein